MISVLRAAISFSMFLFLASCDFASELDQKAPLVSIGRDMNEEHPFEIIDCHILYKGKRLDFNVPIEDWRKILGDYEWNPKGINTHYVWNSMGLLVRTHFKRKTVSGIEWFYYRDTSNTELKLNPKSHIDGVRGVKGFIESEKSWPKGHFTESIRLDGILMDSQFDIHELNQARIKEGLNPFLESMWGNQWVQLRDCPGMELNFSVDPNDDDESKLDSMSFGISWFDSENEKQ